MWLFSLQNSEQRKPVRYIDSVGREFQSVGPLVAEAQSPFVTSYDLGVTSRARPADLNG